MKKDNNYNEIIAGTCLLLTIAKADEILEALEINSIKTIISDFFKLETKETELIFDQSIDNLNKSTDLYEFSKILNNTFSYQDKIDFICCAFEVAFSDGKLHYIEEHFIKKISNTLNVEHSDLIKAKQEIKSLFK